MGTFNAKPTYGGSGTGNNVAAQTLGANTALTKFCYNSGGDIRVTTSAEGFTAASLWCDAKNTDKTTAATIKASANTSNDISSSKIKGKATACVCGASSVFMMGFSLLAILATLWK